MTRKYTTSTYLTVLSNRTVKKSREGGGGGEVVAGGKKMDEYLKRRTFRIFKAKNFCLRTFSTIPNLLQIEDANRLFETQVKNQLSLFVKSRNIWKFSVNDV